MNFKGIVGALALAGSLTFGSCSVGSDLKLENLRQKINDITLNKVILATKTIYKTDSDGPSFERNFSGDGMKVGYNGNCYILTVDHVVSMYNLIFNTPLGARLNPIIRISEETYSNGEKLEEIVNSRDNDIAIFKGHGCNDSIELGDSDKLKILDEIYLVGNPDNGGTRNGIVGSGKKKSTLDESYGLSISAKSDFGDSGNPVVDSRGSIIGFLSEKHGTSSFIILINEFKKYMK